VAVRTIRQLPLHGSNEGDLIHIVKTTSGRGFNGDDFYTYCGLKLTSGIKWGEPQYDQPTCVQCLGTRKKCAWCEDPIPRALFPTDVPERCEGCK
jgi:hypothetical protein